MGNQVPIPYLTSTKVSILSLFLEYGAQIISVYNYVLLRLVEILGWKCSVLKTDCINLFASCYFLGRTVVQSLYHHIVLCTEGVMREWWDCSAMSRKEISTPELENCWDDIYQVTKDEGKGKNLWTDRRVPSMLFWWSIEVQVSQPGTGGTAFDNGTPKRLP